MAYSDYGGRVYRNGERVEERCDAVLSPEGIQSTPGQWPGWSIPDARSTRSFHALMGDGPIFVGLIKQTYVGVFRLAEDVKTLFPNETPSSADITVDGCRLEVRLTNEDNYYVYARLTQPDSTVWTGWSGYGVGAGLEDGDHGFDSDERDAMLSELFSALPPPIQAGTSLGDRGEG